MIRRDIESAKPAMRTARTARKVKFAVGGAAAGTPIGTAACEVAQAAGLEIDMAVCVAVATLLSAGLAWLAGYAARPHRRDQVDESAVL